MKIKAPLILASKSPRRKQLLEMLGLPFSIQTEKVEETYDKNWSYYEVPKYLSQKKAEPIAQRFPDALVIGVDTIVYFQNEILGKPQNLTQAKNMLLTLNGNTHEVISGVTIYHQNQYLQFQEITKVTFHHIQEHILNYYIENYKPIDKAGAYGIQDFWGLVGVKRIEGDFYNVMGLPVNVLFQVLNSNGWIGL